jgi:hypothetical protein
MRDRFEIEDILRNEVKRTTKELEEAKRNFWQICSDVPSGIPRRDGTLRLQKAAHAQTVAMQALTAAINRFNDFLLNGTVPAECLTSETLSKPTRLGR